MRVVTIPRFGDAEVLASAEVPVPEPGPGELSIDVAFAGANYAEVLFRRGLVAVPLPYVPGIEVSGRVRALGHGVEGFAVGQRVCALTIVDGGGYAEVAIADGRLVARVPDDLSLALAAGIPSNSTTATLIMGSLARVDADDKVLVHAAAGGVGSQLGQMARRLGSREIVGTVGSPEKVARALRYGFDEVLIRGHPIGGPYDVIVDPVGGAMRQASLDALRIGGRLIVMGNASGATDVQIGMNELWFSGKTLAGFNLAALSGAQPDRVGAALRSAVAAVAADEMTVDIREVLPLDQAAEAHRQIESGQTTGKLVLATGVRDADA